MQYKGSITIWYDRRIVPGTNWSKEIDQHLDAASLILLLISADFLASPYCYGKEMRHALERDEKGEARVISVLLRPVDWDGAPFSHLQYLPRNAKPITDWPNPDDAFSIIARDIRLAIEQQLPTPQPVPLFRPAGSPVSSGQQVASSVSLDLNREREFIPVWLILIIGLALVALQFISPITRDSTFNAVRLSLTNNLLVYLAILVGLFLFVFGIFKAQRLLNEIGE